jgi:N-acetylglucosaminyldiphosphoundecaprenol N-acetyl-beta-D-mannosaminyltransferase
MRNRTIRERIRFATVGGMTISCLSRKDTVRLMDEAVSGRLGEFDQPLFMTSSNGQVLSMYARSEKVRRAYDEADIISADGQPIVVATRLLATNSVADRSCTTDLFADACEMLSPETTHFFFGATPEEIEKATSEIARTYPRLRIVGYSHGYLDREGVEALLAELESKRPDILWIGLGVPRQQEFVVRNRQRLACVKVIKTAGGLFNYFSGTMPRAPLWMRNCGLEWLYRLMLEPRRLAMRYLVTNPHSFYLLVTRTR